MVPNLRTAALQPVHREADAMWSLLQQQSMHKDSELKRTEYYTDLCVRRLLLHIVYSEPSTTNTTIIQDDYRQARQKHNLGRSKSRSVPRCSMIPTP